jgi:hypothetical protein
MLFEAVRVCSNYFLLVCIKIIPVLLEDSKEDIKTVQGIVFIILPKKDLITYSEWLFVASSEIFSQKRPKRCETMYLVISTPERCLSSKLPERTYM